MDFRPQLVDLLATLTDAVDVPGADVQAMLEVLLDDIGRAVPSCTGLRMSVLADPVPTVVEVGWSGRATRTSVHLLLPAGFGSEAAVTVDLFADLPGAFTALAVDARMAWGPDGEVVVEGDPTGRAFDPGTRDGPGGSTTDAGVVQQAVGFLIDRGHLPEAAVAELYRQARDRGLETVTRARELLIGEGREDG